MSRLRYPFTEVSARCRLCGAEGLTASSEHALGGRLIDWRRSHALVCPEWPRWAEKKGLRLDERGALLYPTETGPYEPRIRPKADGADNESETELEKGEGAESADSVSSDAAAAAAAVPPARADAAAAAAAVGPAGAPAATGATSHVVEVTRSRALWLVSDSGSESRADVDLNGEVDLDADRDLHVDARVDADRDLDVEGLLPQAAARLEPTVSSADEDQGVDAPEPIPLPVAGAPARRCRRTADNRLRSSREAAPEVDLMEVPIERLRQAELF